MLLVPGMLLHSLGIARTARPLQCGTRGGGEAAAAAFLGADDHSTGGDLACGGFRAAVQHSGEGQQHPSCPERDPLSLAPPRLACKTAAVLSLLGHR